ncbi:MAG: hypothetical protein N2258_08345, partial [Brevinematales bacterium]|nr:hypothetical protein [Brevinematales bacterium]
MKRFFLIFLILAAPLFSTEDDRLVCMIYGQKHLFSVITPTNWIFDRELANMIGLPHFIYPESETNPERKNVFIYARGADRKENSKEDFDSFVRNDTNYFISNVPEIKIIRENIKFTNIVKNNFLSGKYYVYKFIFPDGRYESVVYIDAIET